jgi:hypothetical protein
MGCLENELRRLRTKAERCYRLARGAMDASAEATLNAIGQDTDQEIALLEAKVALKVSIP